MIGGCKIAQILVFPQNISIYPGLSYKSVHPGLCLRYLFLHGTVSSTLESKVKDNYLPSST